MLRIGDIYQPESTSWPEPEGATFSCSDGAYALILRHAEPGPRKVAAIDRGPGELAFFRYGLALFVLFRFGDVVSDQPDVLPWFDTLAEPHLWSSRLPPEIPVHHGKDASKDRADHGEGVQYQKPRAFSLGHTRANLGIVLLDAGTGTVLAVRKVLLPSAFSSALRSAAAQASLSDPLAEGRYTSSGLARDVAEAKKLYTSAERAAKASHRTKLPR